MDENGVISVGKEDIAELGEVVEKRLEKYDVKKIMLDDDFVNVTMTVAQLKKLLNILMVAEGNFRDANILYQLRTGQVHDNKLEAQIKELYRRYE